MIRTDADQNYTMRRYYQWHAAIYDATRWTFLFGRKTIFDHLPRENVQLLVEVGCGTGQNLLYAARQNKDWRLIGIDVSRDMLTRACKATATFSRRVQLFEQSYSADGPPLPEAPDLILFSYSLTMFNPGWEAAIDRAWRDLKPGGHIAAVDFHRTTHPAFRWWMERNHVRMDAHLLPVLEARFQPRWQIVQSAWAGLWQYFMFVGQKV